MMQQLPFIMKSLLYLLALTPVESFVASWMPCSSRQHCFATVGDQHLDNLERARESFEQLVLEPHIMFPSSRLTTSSLKRRLVEIQLLESLVDSDEAVEELMSLWLTERDAESARRLLDMEVVCSPGLRHEEQYLRDMIQDYGLDWPEPASRLAALLYFQGESVESKHWADQVLRVKPWHFEATQVQLWNCLRLGLDKHVYAYARQGLPPLNPTTQHRARRKWVQWAVQQAHELLDQAESQQPLHQAKEQENLWQ